MSNLKNKVEVIVSWLLDEIMSHELGVDFVGNRVNLYLDLIGDLEDADLREYAKGLKKDFCGVGNFEESVFRQLKMLIDEKKEKGVVVRQSKLLQNVLDAATITPHLPSKKDEEPS